MTRTLLGTAMAVVIFSSASAFAASAPAAGSSTPATTTPAATTTDAPQPPASLHCTAPKVPTEVKGKDGKTTWKCVKPATH